MHIAHILALMLALAAASHDAAAAADRYGQVVFGNLPVPGATVTAAQEDKRFVTVSDQQGIYRFSDLADGVWTFRVEMLGFTTATQEITIGPDVPPTIWQLKLRSFEDLAKDAVSPTETRQAAVSSSPALPAPPALPASSDGAPAPDPSADGFLINGSVNNGAASLFAQAASFGNNRPGSRSLYNGGLGIVLGNAAWDARPFSFAGQHTPKPSYTDVQLLGTFGGPLKIPGVRNRPTVFLGYQRSADHNAVTQSARMPTSLERRGNFSETVDHFGRPVQLIDPATGLPFEGSVIPADRITPQAKALLNYYPAPNLDAMGSNYQTPVLTTIRQDNAQSRISQTLNTRNQLFGNIAYQRTTTDSTNVFAFADSTRVSAIDAAANWSHRFSMFYTLRLRYQFTRQTTSVTPYFANRANVSGEAGIAGNNQAAVNWGPPNLIFSSGVAALGDVQYARNRNRTHAWNAEIFWTHGRHAMTFGGDIRRQHVDVMSQQDARGTFTFTGSASGSDFADFLLGIPHATSIAFGNADKFFRSSSLTTYVSDDWRLSPTVTVNAGVRWEYESPITERFARLSNLDIAPGFTGVAPVVAADPVGALTGARYPTSLLRPDKSGIQPRIGVAWRPVPGSSLVIRGGYGIYRNTGVYQSLALLMAQQPPFSTTLSVDNAVANPLTLATGFTSSSSAATNTFAVDPDFRVGFARNWQLSAQRDLPASLTFVGTYLGASGSRLMQEILPNTYPAGAVNPCPSCPAGFVYLTSNGHSIRHAAQVQIRRRLRNGLSATVQYTLSKSNDDAGAFTGVSLNGGAIAQDWSNVDAEWGASNFDQRHLLTAQFQYTTGVGVAGGALLNGIKGSLFKGWTVTSQLTAGSGLPTTPVYLTSVEGTGITGTIRADVSGIPADEAPAGFYVNPAAFTAPDPGHWGSARRNSITGPAQFSLNAGIARTFTFGERLNLDWRIDAMNVLNRVTFSSLNTIVGSPQFGLPNRANAMRKIQSTLRLRF